MSLFPTPETEIGPQSQRKPRFGLDTIRDIIIAPSLAFDKIAASPQWLPAYAVIVVFGLLATVLYAPALLHIAANTPPPPGTAVPKTTAALSAANGRFMTAYALDQAFLPLVVLLLTASALTTIARLRGLAVPYVLLLALAANCMIPSVIGGMLSAILVRFHDPASFHDFRALAIAAPTNLALFSTPGNDREVAFLSHFDAFDLWGYVLLAFGFVRVVPISLTWALAIAFGLDFLFALLF